MGERIVRLKQRSIGTGFAVTIAMVVVALPMTAEAQSGNDESSRPWLGTDHWSRSFEFRHRWVNPDSSPGRWGGYRGKLQPPTIEPPEYDEDDWYPMPEPTAGESPEPALPTGTATATAEPVPSYSAPADPDPTSPEPTEPTASASVPIASPGAPVGPGVPGVGRNRSGLPWASGVYARGQGPVGVAGFARWRGRANDVVVDWPARQSWADIVNPGWLYQTWAGTPETKVFGVAPIPEGDPSATMADCAAGAYNAKWRQYGVNIKAAGLAEGTIIRLGWEFNGNWYKWQASNPGQFAACWRQIVGNVEGVAPGLRWDWNVNRGRGQSVADARLAYPGDAYVDIVGVDSYDAWPGARNEAGWQQQYGAEFGLKFWADFAAAHGKQLSVAEWGNYPGPATVGQSGGDNPFYIAKMIGFFRSQGSRLAYEAYFNESASYFAGAIYAPAQVPAAAAQYRKSLTP